MSGVKGVVGALVPDVFVVFHLAIGLVVPVVNLGQDGLRPMVLVL